jgi:hypothetical protein
MMVVIGVALLIGFRPTAGPVELFGTPIGNSAILAAAAWCTTTITVVGYVRAKTTFNRAPAR